MLKHNCLQKSFFALVLWSLLVTIFLSGCSVKAPEGSGAPPVPLNPSVAASFPDRIVLDEAVPINAAIQVTFDQDMNERTICASNIYLSTQKINPLTGEEYSAKLPCLPPVTVNGIVTMRPFAQLVDGQTYTLTVTEYVSSSGGSKLPSTLNWNFVAKDIGRLRVKQGGASLVSGEYSHDMGNMFMNASTENVSIELENYGTKDIEILSIGLSGDDAGDFIAAGTSISTIGKEESENFTIRFFPIGTGPKTATVTIQYRDGTIEPAATGTFTFEVTGYGLPMPDFMVGYLTNPADTGSFVALLPAVGEYDFGSIVLGNSAPMATMAIKNTRSAGGDPVTITGVSGDNSDYILDTAGLSLSLAAEGVTTFTALYTPTAYAAEEKATLVVTSPDVEGGSYPVFLAGICREPEISIVQSDEIASGGTIDFNAQGSYCENLSSTAGSVDLTIKNIGKGNLILTDNPALTGDNASEFSITAGPGSGTVIGEGNSSSITVTYTPGAAGEKTAALVIKSDDLDEGEYTINLTATSKALTAIDIQNAGDPIAELQVGSSSAFKAMGNYEGTFVNITPLVSWSVSGEGSGTVSAGSETATVTPTVRGDINVSISLADKNDSCSFNAYDVGTITWQYDFNNAGDIPGDWDFVDSSGGRGWYYGDSSGWSGANALGCGLHDIPFASTNTTPSSESDGAYFRMPFDFTDITSGLEVRVRVCSTTSFAAYPFLKIRVTDNDWSSSSEIMDKAASNTSWQEWSEDASALVGKPDCQVQVLYDHYTTGGGSMCLWMDWIRVRGTGKIRH